MSTITSQLTNRDIALLVWLTIFVGFILVKRELRRALWPILRLLFWSKLTWFLLAMVAYVGLLIIGGYSLGVWQLWMVKDTFYWFCGSALVTFFNINKAGTDDHFFQAKLVDSLQFATLLAFVVNLYAFNLIIELLLLPTLAFLAMLLVVAGMKHEYALVKRVLQVVSGLIGLAFIGHAAFTAFHNPQSLVSMQNLQDLLLPLVLTVLLLPFVYVVALMSAYELLYVRLKIFGQGRNPHLARFALWQVIKACRWRLSHVQRFSDKFIIHVGPAETQAEVLAAIKDFRATAHVDKVDTNETGA